MMRVLFKKQYNDPKIREAAILVRLAQGGYSRDEAKSLAKDLIKLLGDTPYIINLALHLVVEHRNGDDHLVNFCDVADPNFEVSEHWVTVAFPRATEDQIGTKIGTGRRQVGAKLKYLPNASKLNRW